MVSYDSEIQSYETYDKASGHYNPSFRIIDLISHTTYLVCVNLIHEERDLQFKVNSERESWRANNKWPYFMNLK